MARYQVDVEAGNLNIRAAPNTEAEIWDKFPKGTIFEEVPTEGWCPILMDDGTVGWISRQFIKKLPDDVVNLPTPIPTPGLKTGKNVVAKAMSQTGDPYIWAIEVNLTDPDPKGFDCSELVQWVCAQLKISPVMPDGAIYQYQHCQKYNTLTSISKAVKTPGALLFRISEDGNHVAISRGDGTTIEARGKAYGVGSWAVANRTWTSAALIPGVTY